MKMNDRIEIFMQKLVAEGKYDDLESALADFYNLTDKVKTQYKAEKIREKQMQKEIEELLNEVFEKIKEEEECWEFGGYSYFPRSGVYYTNRKTE